MNRFARVGLMLTLAALGACSASTQQQAVSSSPEAISNTESQALCLAANSGDSIVDRALTAAQSALRERAPTAALWTELGQHWVRKARFSGDPGFYLNVDACVDAALALDAEDGNALALRGLALMNAHRFTDAKRVAQRILDRTPGQVIALGILSD